MPLRKVRLVSLTVRKRVGDVDPGVVVNLHSSHHSHHGLGGYSKLTNGLRAAASGAFVC